MPDQITTKPFRSQAQWRMAFARGLPFARRWARETPGGRGARFRNLPVKIKAPNYGARAGQTIAGRLRRGASGKFESAGGAAAAPKPARRVARAAPKPRKTEQQRAAERTARQAERARQRETERQQRETAQRAERDRILSGVGLDDQTRDALVDARAGDALAPVNGEKLAALGLAEQAKDGSYRLTAAGREVVNAANRGDAGRARDTISRARDQAAARQERQAAQAKPKPAKGGGGKKKKPPKVQRRTPARSSARAPQARAAGGGGGGAPEAKPELPRNLVDAARALSQGRAADVELLIRNGLAKRDKQGRVTLTASGLRAIREKAYTPTHTTDAGHSGVMVALYPDQAAAETIAAQDGVTESVEGLHLTLCFLGDSTEQPLATNKERVIAAVAEWAARHGQPMRGAINGLGRFFHSEKDGTNAVYVAPDVPGLPEQRQSLADWIEKSGFDYSQDHGFTPHITVAYVPKDAPTPPIRVETPIAFDRVTLAWGDEQYEFPLGAPAVKAFTVYKDARGHYRWVAYSSNAYRDRDEEIVSTKALEEDCARADKDGQYGPLRWWHVGGPIGRGWDLGTCDFNAMHGRVLVESGTFKSAAIGAAVAKAAPGLQLSIGFTHAPSEPDRDGVFHHIRRFERSLVPIGRAANPFTKLSVVKESGMDREKETALKAALGDEVAADVLRGAEVVQKDADAQGVAYKSDADPWAALGQQIAQTIKAALAPPAVASVAVEEPAVEPVVEKEAAPAEAKAEDMGMGGGEMLEEEAGMVEETDPGEMTYDEFVNEIRRVVREEIAAELKAQIAPLAGMLDIEKKVSGAVQSLMQPYQAQQATKDDEVASLKATIADQQRRLADLEGDQPSIFQRALGGYRASAATDTIVTKAEGEALGAPNPDADPFADLKAGLFGAPALNGRP